MSDDKPDVTVNAGQADVNLPEPPRREPTKPDEDKPDQADPGEGDGDAEEAEPTP
jgi:hypothetical protein